MRGAREGGREKMGEIRGNASAVPGDKSRWWGWLRLGKGETDRTGGREGGRRQRGSLHVG